MQQNLEVVVEKFLNGRNACRDALRAPSLVGARAGARHLSWYLPAFSFSVVQHFGEISYVHYHITISNPRLLHEVISRSLGGRHVELDTCSISDAHDTRPSS